MDIANLISWVREVARDSKSVDVQIFVEPILNGVPKRADYLIIAF
jgi:hypothetical protein